MKGTLGARRTQSRTPLGDVLILLLVAGFEPFVAWLTMFYCVEDHRPPPLLRVFIYAGRLVPYSSTVRPVAHQPFYVQVAAPPLVVLEAAADLSTHRFLAKSWRISLEPVAL